MTHFDLCVGTGGNPVVRGQEAMLGDPVPVNSPWNWERMDFILKQGSTYISDEEHSDTLNSSRLHKANSSMDMSGNFMKYWWFCYP